MCLSKQQRKRQAIHNCFRAETSLTPE
jgi:hypothetical protein